MMHKNNAAVSEIAAINIANTISKTMLNLNLIKIKILTTNPKTNGKHIDIKNEVLFRM